MIDRHARDKLAYLVKDFASGRITNFQFEGTVPYSSDRAIGAIEDYFWSFYDDYTEHKLSVADVPKTTKKEIARIILFLNSDRSYEWNDKRNGLRFFAQFFKRPKALKALRVHKFDLYNQGDMSVWPFMHRKHMMEEANKPRVGLSLSLAS